MRTAGSRAVSRTGWASLLELEFKLTDASNGTGERGEPRSRDGIEVMGFWRCAMRGVGREGMLVEYLVGRDGVGFLCSYHRDQNAECQAEDRR